MRLQGNEHINRKNKIYENFYDIYDKDIKNIFRYNFLARSIIILKKRNFFKKYDLVHCYMHKLINPISFIPTKTIISLNAYGGFCPKNYLIKDNNQCNGPDLIKCYKCILKDNNTLSKYIPYTTLKYFHFYMNRIRKNKIDGYHCISNCIKNRYVQQGFPEHKMKTIYLPYDKDFKTNKSPDIGLEGNPSLLTVGFLHHHKGFQIAIKAIQKILKSGLNPHLYICGDGPYRPNLEKLSRKLNLENHITFKGFIPYQKLYIYYRGADIFIYPGIWEEGFGRIFLEAMMAGTPTVSSDVGDAKNILQESGVFFRKNDYVDLSNKIIDICNEAKLRYMSKNALKRIDNFAPENFIKQLIDFYKNIINDL